MPEPTNRPPSPPPLLGSPPRLTILLLALAIIGCLVTLVWGLRSVAIPTAHTGILFRQLDQAYRRHLLHHGQHAETAEAFAALVAHWKIDWNTCRLHDGSVFDGWDTPVQVRITRGGVELRSAGFDRKLDTADDITGEIAVMK